MRYYACTEFDITKVKNDGRIIGIDLTRVELYITFSESKTNGAIFYGTEAHFYSGVTVKLNIGFAEFHQLMVEAGKGEK